MLLRLRDVKHIPRGFTSSVTMPHLAADKILTQLSQFEFNKQTKACSAKDRKRYNTVSEEVQTLPPVSEPK